MRTGGNPMHDGGEGEERKRRRKQKSTNPNEHRGPLLRLMFSYQKPRGFDKFMATFSLPPLPRAFLAFSLCTQAL